MVNDEVQRRGNVATLAALPVAGGVSGSSPVIRGFVMEEPAKVCILSLGEKR